MSPLQSSADARRRTPRWVPVLLSLILVVLLLLVAAVLNLLPKATNPLATETKDRTGPVLLKSIQDMSRYEASSGSFQVVVDLDKDAKFLPDAVRGNRTLFVGKGDVGAYVDLGNVGEEAVKVSRDRKAATVKLPHARLEKPALDAERSYAVTKERGILDRLGDVFSDNPNDEREVHKLAVRHIEDAAQKSDLTARAEKNTKSMLRELLISLGYEKVTVQFTDDHGKKH
ncbi:DUF4230 domain-containing protein [Streptomyces albidus (ex Kaewkla and Franco 2022)]|uniref:DUF4230 domain-containing protein n=1 Tax=Streptomyces albidus (ex Kaewkla and Franco 2022) TaxID=722709 RepID=UPI0015EFA012|nr:DUF4230 domain-containing protein [Streptomyces albidus (ex Kaewkla and Franco 2022)]